jgi:fructosamine-3-kinase
MGQNTFRKEHHGNLRVLECEYDGLMALTKVGKVGVVKVLEYGNQDNEEWLVLERLLPPDHRLNYFAFGQNYAEHLNVKVGQNYGWERNNFIGKNVQINTPCSDWWEFYAVHRLEFQSKMALDRGLLDSNLAKAITQIGQGLKNRWGGLTIWPSLLHGDLWAGNHMMRSTGEGVLIDPAVYRGHWEADFAMTKLFGGYPKEFYHGFHSVLPKEKEHEEREILYNLYHVLNHLNLFGLSYLGQVRSMVRSLL